MENTEKIILLVLVFLLLGCDSQKKYYGSNFNQIPGKEIKKVKLNLVRYQNKIYFVSDYDIAVKREGETIDFENKGFLLQDSIYSSKKESYGLADLTVDVPTYTTMK